MSRVYIVTDSTADLTEEEVKQFEISIVPMNISIDDDNYIDGVTITKEEFKQRIAEDDFLEHAYLDSDDAFD